MSVQLLRAGCIASKLLGSATTTTQYVLPPSVSTCSRALMVLRCNNQQSWHSFQDIQDHSNAEWQNSESIEHVELARRSFTTRAFARPSPFKCHSVLACSLSHANGYTNSISGFTVINRHLSNDTIDGTDVEDVVLTPDRKIEKQLMKFMDMWEMDKAIKLLRLAVENDIIPNQTVILNLLQQLANLGEVDFLIEMHQFLLDEKLCSNTSFYTCLQQAYFNSGRIDEGVDFLRKIYHLTRRYQDVDIYFVLLTVMILRHFPEKESWIVRFVTDLAERVPSDHEVRAGLWKCYMLTGDFTKAEKLVEQFGDDMKPFLSTMVNDICVLRNKVETDRQLVLSRLLDFTGLGQKQRALLYQTYIFLLMEDGKYRESLAALEKAKANSIAVKKDNLLPVFDVIQMALSNNESENEEYELKLMSVKTWLEEKVN